MKTVVRCITATALMFAAAAAFAGGGTESEGGAAERPYDVAVIIKATDSDFWQYVLVGARNYAAENPEDVRITEHGPPSEADIAQQVTILEDVIASGVDAIVIASTSSDASVPAIERAVEMGIPVITIDNRVNTDAVSSHLATDNRVGGAMAADKMASADEKFTCGERSSFRSESAHESGGLPMERPSGRRYAHAGDGSLLSRSAFSRRSPY